MGKSCKEVAKSLVDCMKEHECVKKGGEIRKCMQEHPDACSDLRYAYFACKRSGLDMRTRITGQKAY